MCSISQKQLKTDVHLKIQTFLVVILEPSGSQSPLGGLLALDLQLRTRTLVTPSAARAIEPQT